MADSFLAAAAVKSILTKLISLAAVDLKRASGFEGEIKRLGQNLEKIQALLPDVDNGRVSIWMKKLKATAYDADDLLDELAYEVLRRKLEMRSRIKNKVRNLFSPSNHLPFGLKVAHKVKFINSMMDEICKEAYELGLRSYVTAEPREIMLLKPPTDELDVVGRDGDVGIAVDMLLRSNDEDNLPVIAIVGMAGLGKTTLAQLVYKNEMVVRHFDARMWVCVSDDYGFDVNSLLNKMIESITKTNSELSSAELMIKGLRENLNGKKYLLVLDDVWNVDIEKWNFMRECLVRISGARGSKIMITTRKMRKRTMQVPPSLCHHLALLSEDDSWTLFKQRAFANGGPKETPNLVDVGRKIVNRCRGLPLAVKALGGLMHSKKYENDWLLIAGSERWNSPEIRIDILPILRLSFDHLPLSVKQCFAYCSILSHGSCINKDEIIQLWMAQGYLMPPEGSNLVMEDIGDDYFNILVWNSLLQNVERDEYDNIVSCGMHGLVHDFALDGLETDSLNLKASGVYDLHEVRQGTIPQMSRGRPQKLRTLFGASNFLGNMLKEFKSLRALSFGKFGVEKLPSSISRLIHLRYLDISRTPIKMLPNSITELYNLQTLRILHCLFLEELPLDYRNLYNLRHFYMDDDEKHRNLMPMGIGQLTNLQTLPFFVVGEDKGCGIEELGRLINLRGVVKIYNLEHVTSKEAAKQANLSSNSNVHKLEFHWAGERQADTDEDENVLEGLKPHENLKCLRIKNFEGKRLASWMMVMSDNLVLQNLVNLELKNCRRLKHVPALGHLRSMKFLAMEGLHGVKFISSEFYGPYDIDGDSKNRTVRVVFSSLRTLTLSDMPRLVEWSEAAGYYSGSGCLIFPCLEKLKIEGCPKLMTAPSHFPSIKELVIEEINSLALEKMSGKLTSLTSLIIDMASGLEINFVLKNFMENNSSLLKQLQIQRCEELSCLPNVLWDLASLEMLEIWGCPNLTYVPDIEETDSPTRLRNFSVWGCYKLSCLPKGLQNLTSLETLSMNGCCNIMSINPSDMCSLTSLRRLGIAECGILKTSNCWPDWLLSLTSLEVLNIGGFSEELDYFPWLPSTTSSSQEHILVSLQYLVLEGWPKLKSMPEQLQYFTALVDLRIFGFDGLEALPEWLAELSSLKNLQLWHCNNLMHLPSANAMRRLTNLSSLDIGGCPLLEERCKKESGPEWFKIAHIPSIQIGYSYIQLRA